MPKRIFVSFAIEDEKIKNLFTGQAKHDVVPYEFVDMSVKQPWDLEWKIKCRSRIKGCDGVIVLVTPNLKSASGAIWEINCAKEEQIPIRGIYADGGFFIHKPSEMAGILCETWTWTNVANFINGLR